MGGTGSGRWIYHEKKRTVEECWTMSISDVARIVDLKNIGSGSGCVRPTKPTGHSKKMSAIACDAGLSEDGEPLIRLSYSIPNKWGFEYRLEQSIRLQTTQPTFGACVGGFPVPAGSAVRRAIVVSGSYIAFRKSGTSLVGIAWTLPTDHARSPTYMIRCSVAYQVGIQGRFSGPRRKRSRPRGYRRVDEMQGDVARHFRAGFR